LARFVLSWRTMKQALLLVPMMTACLVPESEIELLPHDSKPFIDGDFVRHHADGSVAEEVLFSADGTFHSILPATEHRVRVEHYGTYQADERALHIQATQFFIHPGLPSERSEIDITLSYYADEIRFARGVYFESEAGDFGTYYRAPTYDHNFDQDDSNTIRLTGPDDTGCMPGDVTCASIWKGAHKESRTSGDWSYDVELPVACSGHDVAFDRAQFTVNCANGVTPLHWTWLTDGALIDMNPRASGNWDPDTFGPARLSHLFKRVNP
jgi:hypothetical protein